MTTIFGMPCIFQAHLSKKNLEIHKKVLANKKYMPYNSNVVCLGMKR